MLVVSILMSMMVIPIFLYYSIDYALAKSRERRFWAAIHANIAYEREHRVNTDMWKGYTHDSKFRSFDPDGNRVRSVTIGGVKYRL